MSEYRDFSPHRIVAGEGCWLIDEEGRRLFDGVASLWANVHGHRHPRLDAAIQDQLGRMAHSTLLGLTHPGAVELARQLIAVAPSGLSRVFYSEAGATAVEIALKMAYQACQLRGETRRTRFLRLTEAYHGDTVGAVSVGGISLFHDRFRSLLFPTLPVPSPDLFRHSYGAVSPAEVRRRRFAEATEAIERHAQEACAFVIEPLIQGAAGMIVHPEGYLHHVRELTRKHGILLIVDEVATGFGRTGRLFASEHEGIEPDLLCLGKGLTGGYLPLAATLATEAVFASFLGEWAEAKTFYHGHTYTGNPLACAVALASLQVFEEEQTLAPAHYGPKAERYAAGMERLSRLPHVASVRWRGLMGGAELMRAPAERIPFPPAERRGHRAILEARKRGVLLRPLGDVIVLMPPLAASCEEIDLLFRVTEESILEACR